MIPAKTNNGGQSRQVLRITEAAELQQGAGVMEPVEQAQNEPKVDQTARKRRRLGRLSHRQECALDELLAVGLVSIRWVASEADVPYSTLRRWLEDGHPFKQEYLRRLELRRELCEAAVATAVDPKASPWTRLEAIKKAEELAVPPPNPEQKREDWMLAQVLRGYKFGDMFRGGVEKPEGE
jgi:hypothetical protein